MSPSDKQHAEKLREALHALHHSGPDGFEGFLSVVLGHLTGQTFRLAKAGTQRGRDGDSAFDSGTILFEAKRYETSPDKKEIAVKLFDMAIDDVGNVDLWILGATCEIAAQTITDVEAFGARHGIEIIVLDWSTNDFGGLLLGTVVAGADAKTFLSGGLARTRHSYLEAAALAAIDHFAAHPDVPDRLASLRQSLTIKDVGLGHAKSRNRAWIERLFSNRALARAEFGQPLAPLDPTGILAVTRPEQSVLLGAFKNHPGNAIFAVTGDEGTGKSWLCAKTWLEAAPRSLLLVCPADELAAPQSTEDFNSFLIKKLIHQTGSAPSERAVNRWGRRLNGWRSNPSPENVRLTLVVDGLNEPRKADWPRWLDRAAIELQRLGCCLVVTTRSAHWSQLRQSLATSVTHVPIGSWSIEGVEAMLKSRGIEAEKVVAPVLESLRNPRILGIAVELFAAKEVEHINQLSVGRLIFEHMRKAPSTGAIAAGTEFAELLKSLGKEVLDRIQRQEADDLHIFDSAVTNGLQAVATCRFFSPVPSELLQYEIKPEGLHLGLALYLISVLGKERRNKRDPRPKLGAVLEPIAALDETAAILFLAIQVAFLDEDTDTDVRATLIEHFVSLQNAPENEADAFALLARSSPEAFLNAARRVYTSRSHFPNDHWLLYALTMHRDDPAVWPAIADYAKQWLSLYSLAPERMTGTAGSFDSTEALAQKREKRQEELQQTTDSLTEQERSFVDTHLTVADEWDFDRLLQNTYCLLAGRPLRDFAQHLIRRSVADAYSPALHGSSKEFKQLIRFNRIDWLETRGALINELAWLSFDHTSDVGKWARVEVLRATGAASDADEAKQLADWLTRDRGPLRGWSLLEDYCGNDPCNPDSPEPDNVAATAQRYRAIDLSTLANHMGLTQEDHFFDMARCGVARFHQADAEAAHRAFADHVLNREGLPRRQGTIGLLEHSAVLTSHQAARLLAAGQASTASHNASARDEKDAWLTAQFAIRSAIAHLGPDDQLEAVANVCGENLIVNTLSTLRPASAKKVEQVLGRAVQDGSPSAQANVLAAILYSRAPLSPGVVNLIKALCQSGHAVVRGQALGIAAASNDLALLKSIADSGWDARRLTSDRERWERWHGSSAILTAARLNLISIASALDRMHLDHYGLAAKELGPNGARAVALRVQEALLKALGYSEPSQLPGAATAMLDAAGLTPPFISLDDPPAQDQKTQWERLGESFEAFQARQDRANAAFTAFAERLTAADAGLILSDLTYGGLQAILEESPDAVAGWLGRLTSATDAQLSHLHLFTMQCVIASMVQDRLGGAALLARVSKLQPSLRHVRGFAKLPAEVLLLWQNADAPAIREICKQRLVTCRNDAEISREMLAAYLAGKGEVVKDTIDEQLAKDEPVNVCLALTLAGYSDTDEHAGRIIADLAGTTGFIGAAQRAAQSVYERNAWSKTWFARMREAADKPSFWSSSVLLTKIVDARFDVWSTAPGQRSETFAAFAPTIRSKVERRIERWQKDREKTLFGDQVPAEPFLSQL